MTDGFQVVKRKSDKKRRRKTDISDALSDKINKSNTPPVTSTPTAPLTSIDTSPIAAEIKTFKEIEEGYYLEIVPANNGNLISIPPKHTDDQFYSTPTAGPGRGNDQSKIPDAEAEDLDWQKDFPKSKRRGRPPGSKNKSPVGPMSEEGSAQYNTTNTSGSMDLTCIPTDNRLE